MGESAGHPVSGWRGPSRVMEISDLKGCSRPTGRVGRDGRKAMVNTIRTGGALTAPHERGFPPPVWSQVDWKKAERRVQHRRSRIFRAAKEQRWKHVRPLSTRLLRRYAKVVVSVRRITQVNRGRQTPGIDGARVTTPDARARLVDDLRQDHPWKAAPVRRVDLPTATGRPRPLGIPLCPAYCTSDQWALGMAVVCLGWGSRRRRRLPQDTLRSRGW